MDNIGCLQRRQVVYNRHPTYFTRCRKLGSLKNVSATSKEELGETLKGVPTLEPEQLLDVLGPESPRDPLRVAACWAVHSRNTQCRANYSP